MAALTAFAKHVQPEVPGCPQPIVHEAILQACIEFCERTEMFDAVLPVDTVVGDNTYALTAATGYSAYKVLFVRRGDSPLDSSNRETFDATPALADAGEATHYYFDSTGQLVLGPVPDTVETLSVKAVVVPAVDATTVPDALSARWMLAIAAGAKAKLYSQKNTAWYDPAEAQLKERDFSEAINKAAIALRAGRSGTMLRVAMRPLA